MFLRQPGAGNTCGRQRLPSIFSQRFGDPDKGEYALLVAFLEAPLRSLSHRHRLEATRLSRISMIAAST